MNTNTKPVETTLETLTSGLQNGVTDLPPEAAVGAIIHWESLLAQSEDVEMQSVAVDLASLRGALTRDTLDGPLIGTLLLSLGNRIQNLSGSVDSNQMSSLLSLGDILNQEGARLGGNAAQSDNGSGMNSIDYNGEQNGPEVSGTSLTTGASFTGGSATMNTPDSNVDSALIATDNAQSGRTGGGI